MAILNKTKVYSRPDLKSFDWAEFRRGIKVSRIREEKGFTQVSYLEYDRFSNPKYITYEITGWVPSNILTKKIRRYFYHLKCEERTEDTWELFTDNHLFKYFWSPIYNISKIVSPQKEWVNYVLEELKYKF